MNLSPLWETTLATAGIEAVHWSAVGASDATDDQIMRYARQNGFLVFTIDLDFSAILAHTQARGPSVVQLRTQDVMPDAAGELLIRAMFQFEDALDKGAVLTVDVARSRVRILPMTS